MFETPIKATRQIFTLTEGWHRRLTRKPKAAVASTPVEANARDGQVDYTNRVRRRSAERFSATLTEVFRDFAEL